MADLTSAGVAVVFFKRDDRFAHEVTCGVGCLEEIGLDGLDTPVYQEVHQQGELIFCSGISGDCHWSSSVSPCEHGLLFDVACRLKSPCEEVGAAYRRYHAGGLHVIGKAIDEAEAPTFLTEGDELRVLAPPAEGEYPLTVRFRYEIVARQTRWVTRS